eukprot:11715966-Alexandrium_andersonii.AAC.1
MSASLVGSEMCIRDRPWHWPRGRCIRAPPEPFHASSPASAAVRIHALVHICGHGRAREHPRGRVLAGARAQGRTPVWTTVHARGRMFAGTCSQGRRPVRTTVH